MNNIRDIHRIAHGSVACCKYDENDEHWKHFSVFIRFQVGRGPYKKRLAVDPPVGMPACRRADRLASTEWKHSPRTEKKTKQTKRRKGRAYNRRTLPNGKVLSMKNPRNKSWGFHACIVSPASAASTSSHTHTHTPIGACRVSAGASRFPEKVSKHVPASECNVPHDLHQLARVHRGMRIATDISTKSARPMTTPDERSIHVYEALRERTPINVYRCVFWCPVSALLQLPMRFLDRGDCPVHPCQQNLINNRQTWYHR